MVDDAHFEHGPRRKLERATQHLHALNAQAENLRARTDLHSIVVEYDADEGQYVICHPTTVDPWQSGVVTALLETFGTPLGDFVHNARGALDHTTWRLARRELGREPDDMEARKILFPIAKRPEDFASAAVLAFISDDAGAEMERLQPYHAADPAKHPLAVLHWLSNRDKHRLVTPSFGQADWSALVWRVDGGEAIVRPVYRDFEREPLRMYQGHVEFGRVNLQVLSGEPKLHLERQPSMEIIFTGPTDNVYRDDLRAILDTVRLAVERLDRFL